MPGYDRSGPTGAGPRTGWGLGRCGRVAGGAKAVEEPLRDGGARRRGAGRGLRRRGREGRWGPGRGRRAIDDATASDVTPRRRQAFLKRRIQELTEALDRVNRLLAEGSREATRDGA